MAVCFARCLQGAPRHGCRRGRGEECWGQLSRCQLDTPRQARPVIGQAGEGVCRRINMDAPAEAETTRVSSRCQWLSALAAQQISDAPNLIPVTAAARMTAMTTSKFWRLRGAAHRSRLEPEWNQIGTGYFPPSDSTVSRARACEPLRVAHPIFQNIRAADPVFSASTPEQGASQALARFHHHTTAAGKHGAATLSHSQTFDPKFHPSSIGPPTRHNLPPGHCLERLSGSVVPEPLLCQFTAATSWPICTSAVALKPAKKKKDAVQPSLQSVCRGPGDSTTAVYHQSPAHAPS